MSDNNEAPKSSAGRKPKKEKKERVLHTRIPAILEQELKSAAEGLRIPVSNLVRTILEDAVNVADRATERVEESLKSAANSVHVEREKLRRAIAHPDDLASVIAYQAVNMAQKQMCAKCGYELPQGEKAAMGITDKPGPKVFVCLHASGEPGQESNCLAVKNRAAGAVDKP